MTVGIFLVAADGAMVVSYVSCSSLIL